MGRLHMETLERVERFGDRVLDVVDALDRRRVRPRVLDQMTGCGTSVGANAWEADEAMSRKDFAKTLGVVPKELNETRYWLRLVGRREWLPADRLEALETEAVELKRMFGAMVSRTNARS